MAAEAPSVGVVGRESELGSIDRFLEAVRGGPAALLIEGEPGIGKTTLWNEGVAVARRTSYTVLSSRPTNAEAKLPYQGLGDLRAAIAREPVGRHPPRVPLSSSAPRRAPRLAEG